MNDISNRTENGRIFKCASCHKIHVEYKNLSFSFSKEEYRQFADYFMHLDGEYWEKWNHESIYRRKIVVPIGHKNLKILLNHTELQELKSLFSGPRDTKPRFIKSFNFEFYNN